MTNSKYVVICRDEVLGSWSILDSAHAQIKRLRKNYPNHVKMQIYYKSYEEKWE